MPARSSPAAPMASASSPAAMTARWCRPMRTANFASSLPTTRSAGSTRSRSGPTARWPGRPAKSPTCSPKRARTARTRRRPPWRGLLLRPRACGLAIAHYNGVTLWFPNAAGVAPEKLEWKGSHLGVAFSPDGRFVVTCMQEPTLHGWRLADAQHMRMSGYSARVRSLVVDLGRGFPGHIRGRAADFVAVRRQRRAHGQAAETSCPFRGARFGRCVPSQAAGGRRGLCRWCRAAGANRRWRADLR